MESRLLSYRVNTHSKYDLKVVLVWIPKYWKKILTSEVTIRNRDLLRQIHMEHELHVILDEVSGYHLHKSVPYR